VLLIAGVGVRGLVARGKRVHGGVVEQGVVAIAPREGLVANAEMAPGPELLAGLVVANVVEVGVEHAQPHAGARHHEEGDLPWPGGVSSGSTRTMSYLSLHNAPSSQIK